MKAVFVLFILTLSGGSRFFGSFLSAQNYPDKYWSVSDDTQGQGAGILEFISKDSVILSRKIERHNSSYQTVAGESDIIIPDSKYPNTFIGTLKNYSDFVYPYPLKKDKNTRTIFAEKYSDPRGWIHSLGYPGGGAFSCSQGVLALPSPSETNVYTIFSYSFCGFTDQLESRSIYANKLKIREGQEAEILETDILLFADTTGKTTFSESIFGVKHTDGMSWWIVARQTQNNKWMIFKYDETGIRLHRVLSVGEILKDRFTATYSFGDFSPDGTQLAFTLGNGQTDIFDFDRCEGNLVLTKKIIPHKKIRLYTRGPWEGAPKNNSCFVIFAKNGTKLFLSSVIDDYNEDATLDSKLFEVALNQNSFDLKPKDLKELPKRWSSKMLRNPFDYTKLYVLSSLGIYKDGGSQILEITTNQKNDSLIYLGNTRLKYLKDDITSLKLFYPNRTALYPNYRLGAQPLKEATRAGRWGDTLYICGIDTIGLGIMPKKYVKYEWFPSDGLSSDTIANPTFYPERTGKRDSLFQFVLTAKGLPYSCWDGETMTDTVWVKIIPRNQSPCTYTSSEVLPLLEKVNLIDLYPNPAYDFIILRCNTETLITIVLSDITGKTLITKTLEKQREHTFDTSNLSSGVYVIKAYSKDNSFTEKFVIVR